MKAKLARSGVEVVLLGTLLATLPATGKGRSVRRFQTRTGFDVGSGRGVVDVCVGVGGLEGTPRPIKAGMLRVVSSPGLIWIPLLQGLGLCIGYHLVQPAYK